MKLRPYKTVEEYLENFSGETRAKLDELRKKIHDLFPEAQEKISYGIPTFTKNGKNFVYIAGYEKHISIYPIPHPTDVNFEHKIDSFRAGKGTLLFEIDKPLPMEFIARIITELANQRSV